MMSGFWRCIFYLAVVGIVGFVIGRILPKRWFRADKFPYRPFRVEDGGKIYLKLKIRKWQNKIPDMSKILPGLMPAKAVHIDYGVTELTRMIQETCVAELIHVLLSVSGLFCVWLWKGLGGAMTTILYVIGNLPFILVQRFNRPRLQRLLDRLERGSRIYSKQEDELCVC